MCIRDRIIPFSVAENSVATIEITDRDEVESLSSRLVNSFRNYEGVLETGIRISTDVPVTVYAMNSAEFTSDGMLVLPTSALGSNYQVVGYTTRADQRSIGSQMAVLAVEDNTEITIEASYGVVTSGSDTAIFTNDEFYDCLLYTSPSPRDATLSRMPSSA